MDNEGKIILATLVLAILTLVITISWNTQSTNKKIVEMVAVGANPMDAACALSSDHKACLLAARKN